MEGRERTLEDISLSGKLRSRLRAGRFCIKQTNDIRGAKPIVPQTDNRTWSNGCGRTVCPAQAQLAVQLIVALLL